MSQTCFASLTNSHSIIVNGKSNEVKTVQQLGFATLAFNNISGIGRPGTGTLKVDGKLISTQRLDRTVPLTLPWDETFDIGSDTGTPVDDHDYQVPFKFTGKIDKLTVTLDRPKLTPEECRSTFDLISAPCAVKMSQKSSLPQSLHSVKLVLTGNTESSAASGS